MVFFPLLELLGLFVLFILTLYLLNSFWILCDFLLYPVDTFEDVGGGFDGPLAVVDLMLELKHLQVVDHCTLSHGVMVEVVAVLHNRINMLDNILELLHRLSHLSHPVVSISTVDFVPHGLHLVHVEVAGVILLTEHSHSDVCSLYIINLEEVLGAESIEVSISLV